MKNDMRITYPLWQMAGIFIIMGFVLVAGYSTTTNNFSDGGFGFEFDISFNSISGVIAILLLAATVLYFVFLIFRFRNIIRKCLNTKSKWGHLNRKNI